MAKKSFREQFLRAKHVARELTLKYSKYTVPPILSEKIVQSEGLFLSYKNFHDSSVACLDRDSKTIVMTANEGMYEEWGNFALAHELGHWYLHTDKTNYFHVSSLRINTARKVDLRDLEANLFAVNLLIPENMFSEWNWLSKDVFSAAFQIPEEVLEFRNSIVRDPAFTA